MRIKRQKEYRRTLRYYRINFCIKPPYKVSAQCLIGNENKAKALTLYPLSVQVLLDGNFIHQCVHVKLPLERQMKKILEEESVQLYVPRAVIKELEALGEAAAESLRVARSFKAIDDPARPSSGKEEEGEAEPLDPHESIQYTVGKKNEEKYFVATQDFRLRTKLRNLGGIPTMYMNQNVIVLEAPGKASVKQSVKVGPFLGCLCQSLHYTTFFFFCKQEQEERTGASTEEMKLVKAITGEEQLKRKKKRGPKGPNPLSMLPSKKRKTETPESETKPKRNRRKTKKSSAAATES